MASTAKRHRKMSFDQFLTHLRKLRGQFTLNHGRAVRMVVVGHNAICPVSGVCNMLRGTEYHCEVLPPATALNMSKRLAWHIADAADNYDKGRPIIRNYRNRMLRALNLREVL